MIVEEKEIGPDQYSGPSEFVHLHLHTLASTLDGVPSAEQYADACLKAGFPAMAATEHGHMASFPDIYFAFKKRKLKGVAGAEIYYNDYEPLRKKAEEKGIKRDSLPDKLKQRIMRNRHLTVLAKNSIGVSNLIKLTTLAWEHSYIGKPRIWFDRLCEFKEGLIVLSGCINGPISYELRLDIDSKNDTGRSYSRSKADKTALTYLKEFKDAFGEDFFIEVQMPCLPELHDTELFRTLIEYADAYSVKPVLSNDVHYLTKDDAYIQRVMMAVDQKTNVNDKNMFTSQSDEQYFKSRAQLWATFKNHGYAEGVSDAKFEEICDNTLLIADRCEVLSPDMSPKIPDWSAVEKGVNANARLREIVYEQLKLRGWDKDTKKWPCDGRMVTYAEQAEIELERFIDKGFSSYFLITRDWIQWGREKGWPFGPRGCTIPNSLILVGPGVQKKIEDLTIGDEIIDGFSNKQTIENKFIYDISEELYVFELDDGEITVTADHKFYVIRDGVVVLLPASEIKSTDEFIGNLQD
jgi:DNA polymerase-3 subunit alpha